MELRNSFKRQAISYQAFAGLRSQLASLGLQLAAYGLWLTLSGCSISLTGAALAPDVKTFSVETFPNRSGQGPAGLSQNFTEDFRDYFQRNSSLKLDPSGNGDLQFSGAITGYTIAPVNASSQNGQERAAANRLTVTIQVRYVNTKDEKANFDQSFSGYEDFEQSRSAGTLDDGFIRQITNRILTDTFSRSLANW